LKKQSGALYLNLIHLLLSDETQGMYGTTSRFEISKLLEAQDKDVRQTALGFLSLNIENLSASYQVYSFLNF